MKNSLFSSYLRADPSPEPIFPFTLRRPIAVNPV